MPSLKEHLARLVNLGGFCAMLTAISIQAAASDPGTGAAPPWDWLGVIGTGQSLAVGDHGRPVLLTKPALQQSQALHRRLPWPVDPDDTDLSMAPLVEPIGRNSTSYPSSWPDNIAGETPHSAMGNQITELVRNNLNRDFISVQGEVGENGQCMIYLKKSAAQKGVNGRSYEAALIETKAITRLAKAAGKTYGVGAIIVTHGECDAGNANYAIVAAPGPAKTGCPSSPPRNAGARYHT